MLLLHPRIDRRSGFTLIELVISSALMAVILASAYFCLSACILSQKMVQARADAAQGARIAMALISADLRAACPLSKDIDFLGMRRKIGIADADNLDFATHNYKPAHARESDWCEVSYFLSKDPDSGDFTLFRRRDPTPDPEPLAGGSHEEIATGLSSLRLEYYDGLDWYDDWGDPTGKKKDSLRLQPNLSGMPEAVRITLAFNPNPLAKKRASAEPSDNPEPPLIFQTVARLNLVDLAGTSGSGSKTNSPSSSGSGDQSQNQGGFQ